MAMRDKIEHAIQNQPCTVKDLKNKFGGDRGAFPCPLFAATRRTGCPHFFLHRKTAPSVHGAATPSQPARRPSNRQARIATTEVKEKIFYGNAR